ncbi:hypothetical protein COLU111180_03395 [Cohnella lubricantis]|uniref:Glycosyltransferase RgtA/B/C/D-like domain-containing protein n=1 Tax=Cohnella lubricantis TaxID=2163172 RepID=A0A841THR5_9BACL|nr:hypothetical protein [Cohnella lubricantis]MBB6678778.1 hypothetical protein [Cohnella lubricantis]MBP2117862.1 hypothetical protein [Cohnella lubricantis]
MKQTITVYLRKMNPAIASPFLPLGLFLLVSLIRISLPGLYMDSVLPDYYAAYIGHQGTIPAWIFPDNMLFSPYEYPLLSSLYGGATPAYIGKLVWSVIGYNIFSIRLLHLSYGLIIVYFCYIIIRWATENKTIASFSAMMIAIDPSFVLAWRTQYYLQLFPLITFILSLLLFTRFIFEMRSNNKYSIRTMVLIGLLLGFSAWGYFIYTGYALVFFGVLLILLFSIKQKKVVIKTLSTFIVSFIGGYLPFIYAHFSIFVTQGIQGYLTTLRSLNSAYEIGEHGDIGFLARFHHVWELVKNLSGGDVMATTMVGQRLHVGVVVGEIVFIISVLIALIFLSLRFTEWFNKQDAIQHRLYILTVLTMALIGCHIVFGIIIGPSLGYQHFVMLLPLTYLSGTGAGYGIYSCIKDRLKNKLVIKCVVAVFFVLLAATYVNNNSNIYSNLKRTGGVGYYSDSINRLAEFAQEIPPDAVILFPQWGYWMGVATATGGTKEIWSETSIEQLIEDINNRPAKFDYYVVLEPANEQAVKDIGLQTDLSLKEIIRFHTREGIPTFFVAHYHRDNLTL